MGNTTNTKNTTGLVSLKVYSAVVGNTACVHQDASKVHVHTEYKKFIDPRRNAKIFKILPHLYHDQEWSIWLDGNVTLNCPPAELISFALSYKKDVLVFSHHERNCVYKEAQVCEQAGLDDKRTIDAQMQRYKVAGYPEGAGLGACFLIVRKNTPKVNALNEKWWAEICRGSVRDQLSFPYVFREHVHYLPSLPYDKPNYFFTRI